MNSLGSTGCEKADEDQRPKQICTSFVHRLLGHLDSALTPRHPSNSIQLIAVTMAELSPFPICSQKSDSHAGQPHEL
ncbi:hypothetical protein E2C01_014087 [Portunus trituberculatus]|uniref:Uncharacterized protein n=1 Tax=Portunus trituberculatus TaxID=210409 RepID=A0A5B7DHW6_PORTR|nr:hypothetical protein [Portunus trituberculatus]